MAWTYDENLAEPRDQVRFRIGDTKAIDPQLQDEEIDFLLGANADNVLQVAILAVRGILARYSRGADKWVGDLKILYSQRVKNYQALLEQLESEIASLGGLGYVAMPSAGGVYVAEESAMRSRTDVLHSSFYRGMHDNLSTNEMRTRTDVLDNDSGGGGED